MTEQQKRRQGFLLRLSPTLRNQATEIAQQEGISLNHFISLAVTEKVTRMEQTVRSTPGIKQRSTGAS